MRKRFGGGGRQLFIPVMIFLILFISAGVRGQEKIIPCLCNELDKKVQDWRLYLYAKDPLTWQVINGGAWAELNINRPSGKFTLEAHGLQPKTEYALIRYAGQTRTGQVLSRVFTDHRGNFRSSGVWPEWSGKLWVVLGKDLQENPRDFKPGMRVLLKDWHPKQYLFESEIL
jgi:hypothetical protein